MQEEFPKTLGWAESSRTEATGGGRERKAPAAGTGSRGSGWVVPTHTYPVHVRWCGNHPEMLWAPGHDGLPLDGSSISVVSRELMMFLLFGSVALSVGNRSSMTKIICLAVVWPHNPCSRAYPSPRPVENGSHASWMLDFTYLLLVAERNSLPVPMPRKRRPQSSPHPSDQSQQPPVPRPRSKLTEVVILVLLGAS